MTEHRWGTPDSDGVKKCLAPGCEIESQMNEALQTREWRKDRGVWRSSTSLPVCTPQPQESPVACLDFRALREEYAQKMEAIVRQHIGKGVDLAVSETWTPGSLSVTITCTPITPGSKPPPGTSKVLLVSQYKGTP